MNNVETINLLASISSLVLAILAIYISLYFFRSSKDSEKKVEIALKGIETQTNSLDKLITRILERFTRYATSPRQADEVSLLLLQMIESRNNTDTRLDTPDSSATNQVLRTDLISSYMVLYHYCAVTNIAAQSLLPDLNELTEDNYVKKVVDQSHQDFCLLETMITDLQPSDRDENPKKALFDDAYSNMREYVKDSTTVYSNRTQT
ncbi:hypothetical protein C4544_07245 [candidate division WS5 bacterium]|uniref:DUF4760 domain-containing protein n=1 Tax=candidate division WS5 bacterium TaxID=2093353 RepID=A0A419DAK8_9BACT|nr:MAG: hypothetical protein C4544_07245 [candidate division WS5 bacterium]